MSDVVKFIKVDESALNVLSNEIYEEVYQNDIFIKDLNSVLNQDISSYATSDRPTPKYVDGYLDKPFLEGGKPKRPKDLLVYNTVLSGNYTLVEIEGGVRGGKDVIALLAWSRYLMVCPDELHLALGSSLEHVLRTVLMSGGFGLFYTIPHGIFIRESVSGAQRGVYKFLDVYGLEKTVLFYGNDKENDSDKYQGFTIGSVYVNETLNQHVRGLEQGINRIASSSQPLMIMTQNPKGANHPYYQKFEKPKLANDVDIASMEWFRDNFKDTFEQIEKRLLKDRAKEVKSKRESYIASKNKSTYDYLNDNDKIVLHKLILDVNYKYDRIIRNIPCQKFLPTLKENDYLYDKSAKKVISYFVGEKNSNNIKNAYNFAYFHYTIDDNMKLGKMQINDFKMSRGAPGQATYDQEVSGIRRSTEGAVYTGFTSQNIFKGNINDFDWGNKLRFIVIDPGFNHPTGMTDWAVDLDTGIAYCLQERKIDFNIEYVDRKSMDVIYSEFLLMVRRLHNRQLDNVIIDPSKPELIRYMLDAGWNAYPANNANWTTKDKEKTVSEEITSRELRGIPLVQTAFAKNKIFIHEDCVELRRQIESYTYEKTKDGTDKLQDLDDDLVVTVKYLVNTSGIVPTMWLNEEGGGLDEQTIVSKNESGEDSEWDMGSQINQAFSGFNGFESSSENGQFFESEEDSFF